MYQLCDKMKNLVPYEPIAGSYQIRLDANESYFSLPDTMKQKISDMLQAAPLNRYPDPYAEQLCAAFAARYGLDPQYVTAGNGSDELISIITATLLEKDARILTFSHDFSMYRFYGDIYEKQVFVLDKRDDLTLDIDLAIQTVKENQIEMVIFSNPCNPTSIGIGREDVRKLIRATDALVVLDEAYMDFWDQSLLSEAADYDNLIILRTCSKLVGLAGLRLGFAVAGPVITRALRAAKSPYNVNTISQKIGAMVLSDGSYLDRCADSLLASKVLLMQALRERAAQYPDLLTEIYNSCTNFVFLRTPAAKEIFEALKKRSIVIRYFGDALRITAGSPEENAALLDAMDTIFADLSAQ